MIILAFILNRENTTFSSTHSMINLREENLFEQFEISRFKPGRPLKVIINIRMLMIRAFV